MAINASIEADFDALEKSLKRLEGKALTTIVKRSMDKGHDSLVKRALQMAQKERYLKQSVIKSRYFRLRKAKGVSLNNLSAALEVSNAKISMANFVKGPRVPRKQKGIPIAKRKRLRFEVRKGRRFKGVGGIFLARGVNKNVHVFRRGPYSKVKTRIIKQSLSGFARYFRELRVRNQLTRVGQLAFLKDLTRRFDKRIREIR